MVDLAKRKAGSAFIALELVLHVYLSIYLTFHWTNWTIWGFTAFETLGFIYLLLPKRKEPESIAVKHMRHFQFCGCLGYSAMCCRVLCECKRGK